jgi:putative membrane protein
MRARSLRWLACAPACAWAHHTAPGQSGIEPWAVACLVAALVLYAAGVARLWRRAGPSRGIVRREVTLFGLGWLALAAALLPPLDSMSSRSFAVHMVQHETLMVIAAPLLVLSRPLEAWTWALAPLWRRAFAALARARWSRRAWGTITEPLGAWSLHAIALWAWHIPVLFDLAVENTGVHILQHASFFATALCFWWSVLGRGSRGREGVAFAVLFTTMLHTSALGALLALAPSAWYAHYAGPGAYGLTALEDQQLGGLIMWAPAGLAYVVAALFTASRWLRPPLRTAGSRAATSPPAC